MRPATCAPPLWSVSVSSWSLNAQSLYKPTQPSQGRGDTETAPQAHSSDITFRAQGTARSITALIVLSIMLTGGTLAKNSKFKGKYLRNENVNVAHPIKRHAENGWRQTQYGELGNERKNWELLPASWMSGLHSLWGRCFLVHIQIRSLWEQGGNWDKSILAQKGRQQQQCLCFIPGDYRQQDAAKHCGYRNREIEINRILRIC